MSSEPDTLTLVGLRANDLSMLTPSARSGDDALPLVEAARAGDRGAFAALYDRYVRMVHGIVLSRVHRSHVDDLVQDVFVHALGKLASLREPAAFGGWLATIARNRATDHLRQYGRNEVPLENDAAGPHEDRAEALAALAVLRTLPDAYRETLALRLIEGMTGPEIAERTGLTSASVRVNLHRGMKLLRARLQGDAHRE